MQIDASGKVEATGMIALKTKQIFQYLQRNIFCIYWKRMNFILLDNIEAIFI